MVNDVDGPGATRSPAAPVAAPPPDMTREGAADAGATTAAALAIVAAAGVLGILGDALLRATPWGINVLVWAAALLLAVAGLTRHYGIRLQGEGRWLALPALFFAAAFAWRDSPILGLTNLMCLLIALALAAWRSSYGSLRLASLTEMVWAHLLAVWDACTGLVLLLFKDVRWAQVGPADRPAAWAGVLRGLLLALPLLLVFGGLFAAADEMFRRMVVDLLHFDLAEWFGHLALIVLWMFLAAGFVRRLALVPDRTPMPGACPLRLATGITEVGVVLGLVDLLFLTFVGVQFRYFFGGAEVIKAASGMGYSEYARRGFFELMAVMALVLPLLLFADWWLRKDRPSGVRLFRLLSLFLIVLVFVVMASALLRMRLNQDEQGMTELRLYPVVFMGWLALVFVWFAVTVLRGQRQRFAFGALVTGFAAVALLNIINPDDWITRANMARMQEGRPFDAAVVGRLSADATPAIAEAWPALPQADKRWAWPSMAEPQLRRWSSERPADWQTWNWSRLQASQAVRVIRPPE